LKKVDELVTVFNGRTMPDVYVCDNLGRNSVIYGADIPFASKFGNQINIRTNEIIANLGNCIKGRNSF
jgi:hypothetical protein